MYRICVSVFGDIFILRCHRDLDPPSVILAPPYYYEIIRIISQGHFSSSKMLGFTSYSRLD